MSKYRYKVISYHRRLTGIIEIGYDTFECCQEQANLIEQYKDKNGVYRIEIREGDNILWHKNIGT